jgi:hypothetical protein
MRQSMEHQLSSGVVNAYLNITATLLNAESRHLLYSLYISLLCLSQRACVTTALVFSDSKCTASLSL